jgi:hypothetical protein
MDMPLLGDGANGPRLSTIKYHATKGDGVKQDTAHTTDLYSFSPTRTLRSLAASSSAPRGINKDLDAVMGRPPSGGGSNDAQRVSSRRSPTDAAVASAVIVSDGAGGGAFVQPTSGEVPNVTVFSAYNGL